MQDGQGILAGLFCFILEALSNLSFINFALRSHFVHVVLGNAFFVHFVRNKNEKKMKCTVGPAKYMYACNYLYKHC